MTNPDLYKIVKYDPRSDCELANHALKLGSEIDKLRITAAVAPTQHQAQLYEERADQLIEERRTVIAGISDNGVIKYNI